MQRRLIPGALLLLTGAMSAAGPQQAAAAIAHRYSFTTNANDSIGTAHGTLMDAGAPTAVFANGQLDVSANTGQGSNSGITEDAWVNLPNGIISAAATTGNGSLSIELWATVSTTRTWQRFVDFGTSNDGEDTSNGGGASGYVYISPNSGRWNNGLATETHEPNGPADEAGLAGPLPNNVQVHVVGTYDHNDLTDGLNGTMKLYLNGSLVDTAAIADLLDLRTFTNDNNYIGRAQWPDPIFDGLYNELRIYSNALTQADVTSHTAFGPDVLNPGGIVGIEVNKTTGAITLKNTATSPLAIDHYRIGSVAGGLNFANWNSLDDQNFSAVDGPDGGAVAGDSVGEGWDQAGGSNNNQLVEQFLGENGSTIAASSSMSLGNAYNSSVFAPGADGDLVFELGLNNGALITVPVTYVTGGGLPGDFNNSGKVDGADFLLWQRNFGQPGYDAASLAAWKANFGSGAAVAAAGAVPEPAAFALIAMAGAALAASRRKR
jgi:hypothetical protein